MSTMTTADTIRTAIAAMLPPAPAGDPDTLRAEAERAREAEAASRECLAAVDREIEAARAAREPRPELAQAVADLQTEELRARIRGEALPAGHAKRLAAAREAVTAAEVARQAAEAAAPMLADLRAEVATEVEAATAATSRAAGALGNALAASLLRDAWTPALAELLQVEARFRAIEHEHGTGAYLGHRFRAPSGGDWCELSDLLRAAEREAEGAAR